MLILTAQSAHENTLESVLHLIEQNDRKQTSNSLICNNIGNKQPAIFRTYLEGKLSDSIIDTNLKTVECCTAQPLLSNKLYTVQSPLSPITWYIDNTPTT